MARQEMRDESPPTAVPCRGASPAATHDMLRLGLMEAGRRVRAAAEDGERFPAARDTLVRFCFAELLPHLEADESWLSEARDCPEGRLLAHAIRTEARAMTAAVYELLAVTSPCEAVAATRVLHALLAAHAHHEDLLTHSRLATGGGTATP